MMTVTMHALPCRQNVNSAFQTPVIMPHGILVGGAPNEQHLDRFCSVSVVYPKWEWGLIITQLYPLAELEMHVFRSRNLDCL